jgi:hypothetical protein
MEEEVKSKGSRTSLKSMEKQPVSSEPEKLVDDQSPKKEEQEENKAKEKPVESERNDDG